MLAAAGEQKDLFYKMLKLIAYTSRCRGQEHLLVMTAAAPPVLKSRVGTIKLGLLPV
jgi:hypothetical protein